MLPQPFTACNSCFHSLIYLILYSRQAGQPNRLQHTHSGALSDNGQKYEFYIRHWHRHLGALDLYTCTTKAGSSIHSHKRLKLSGVTQSYSVIPSIASAAPEFADTLFTDTISKYSSFILHTLTLLQTLIQDIFIHFTATIVALSLHPLRVLLVLRNRIFPLFFVFFEFPLNLSLCRLI